MRKPSDSAARSDERSEERRPVAPRCARRSVTVATWAFRPVPSRSVPSRPVPSCPVRPVLNPEPAEAGSMAIQHYLVRRFCGEHPLLHGLSGAKGTRKMLSYTTPVQRTRRDGTGTERDGTGRDGTRRAAVSRKQESGSLQGVRAPCRVQEAGLIRPVGP